MPSKPVRLPGKQLFAPPPAGGGTECRFCGNRAGDDPPIFSTAPAKAAARVRYDDLPPCLVHAILSGKEQALLLRGHGGFDFVRIVGGGSGAICGPYQQPTSRGRQHHHYASGTLHVAFRTSEPCAAKVAESLVFSRTRTRRFSKQQFSAYANEVYSAIEASVLGSGIFQASRSLFRPGIWRELDAWECGPTSGNHSARPQNLLFPRRIVTGARAGKGRATVCSGRCWRTNTFKRRRICKHAKWRALLKIVRGIGTGSEAPYLVDMV